MTSILFALITFFTWGTGDIFTTIASRKMGSYNASFYGYFIGFIIASLYIPFSINSLKDFSFSMILLTVFLAVIQLIGFFAFNEGLKTENASLVGTISGSFTSLVVIMSLIFLDEKLFMQQIIAIVIIFIGLILASINYSDLKKRNSIINKGSVYAFISMISWAVYFTFIKIPVKEVGFFWPTYLTDMVGSLVFIAFGFKLIKKPRVTIHSGFPAVLMEGILLSIGTFAFNIAISMGLSSVVAPIAGAYPALFALLAYFIFRDPITHQQKFGMVVTLIGIIFLAYFSK